MQRRTILDRALATVGLERSRPPVRKRQVYAGAKVTSQTQDWFASMLSADRALKGDFRLLRDRARQLGRDNPHIARYRGLQADNVIGPDGIRLQSLVKQGSEYDRETNRKIEAAWDEWTMPEFASVDGLLSLTDIATLAVERWKEDGEALIRLWPGFNNKFAFALQMLDADVLDHTLDRAATDKNNEIRMGVERDQFGKPVNYWLWKHHPTDYLIPGNERVPVPAAEIIHIYTIRRPGQTRGVTEYAAVMVELNILGAYQEAELTAARVSASACYAVTPGGEDSDDGIDPDAEERELVDMEPGMGFRLAKGDTITLLDPKHPVQAFGTFLLAALRSVSSGLHTAYSSLTGDLSQANYGSQRQGLLSERDGYKRAQRTIATKLYRRVYLRWLKFAMTTGALDVPIRQYALVAAHGAHRWLPRGFPWIDPKKDLEAAELELKNRLNTHTNIAAEDGRDWEEVLAATADEEALAAEYGVLLPDLSRKTGQPEDQPDDAGTGNDPNNAADGNGNTDDGSADDGTGDRHSPRSPRGRAKETGRRRFFEWGGRRQAG